MGKSYPLPAINGVFQEGVVPWCLRSDTAPRLITGVRDPNTRGICAVVFDADEHGEFFRSELGLSRNALTMLVSRSPKLYCTTHLPNRYSLPAVPPAGRDPGMTHTRNTNVEILWVDVLATFEE